MLFDVVIVGGGPGGLQAALTLGRGRKRVLVCDAGPRRNAAATHINNFVTRDGTPPDDFRAAARADLAAYPSVEVRDTRVERITGERNAFEVTLAAGSVRARRVLLATGMIDELLPIPGFREQWGQSVFQCPYCHGWEVRDRRWGFLALPHASAHLVSFALMIRGWSADITVFTNAALDVPADARAQLAAARVPLETAAITRLVAADDGHLAAIELAGDRQIACDVLFVQPPQHQPDLVRALGVALDDDGFIKIDAMKRETSVAGVYASGDATTRMQSAVAAAASGMHAAAALNGDLALDWTAAPGQS
jgi:thioredoxin reductase